MIKHRKLLLAIGLASLFIGQQHPVLAQRVHVYHAARIWTGKGQPVNNATMIVKGGRIVTVGPRNQLKTPPGSIITDLGHQVVIPGLVIAETNLAEPGRDEERSISPSVQAIEGFDFFADYWKQLAGGVTTVQLSPGARRLMPGRGSVVKLAGPNNGRVLRGAESLRVVLSSDSRRPPKIYRPPIGAVSVERPLRPTQPQIGGSLNDAVSGLRLLFRSSTRYRPLLSDSLETQLLMVTLNNVRVRKQVVRVTAKRAVEVTAALGLAREFQFPLLLVGPQNVDAVINRPDLWKASVHGVILQPPHRPGRIVNTTAPKPGARKVTSSWEYAEKLHQLGVPVAIKPQSDADLPETLFLAGSFVSRKLDPATVLAMLTSIPAKMMGVAERVGELTAGRDADFVVLSADPFSVRSQIRATYVTGTKVYDSEVKDVTTVVRAGRVYTEQGIVRNGAVVVRGNSIRNVGDDVSAPLNANIRRYPNGVIVPGFIDFGSAFGSTASGSDPAVKVARQGGVTTVLRSSGSSVVAVKLGSKVRTIQRRVALRFVVTGNLTATIPGLRATLKRGKDYHEKWTKYEADLAKYQAAIKAKQAAAKAKQSSTKTPAKKTEPKKTDPAKKQSAKKSDPAKKDSTKKDSTKKDPAKKDPAKKDDKKAAPLLKAPKAPTKSASLEPYRALFTGQIPAVVTARETHTVAAALKLFRDEFKLRTILSGGDALVRNPDFIAAKKVAVAVGPNLVPTIDRRQANLAQILANRQIPFAFQSNATTGASMLPLAVTYAVRKGLGKSDALYGLTAGPAKLVSIDGKVGSIKAGKDADLVVLSGPPFELSTRVLAVMIDGRWVYEREKKK